VDAELVLRKDQVPATRLGQSRGNAPRLGWVSWLGDRPRQRDATDVRMRAEGMPPAALRRRCKRRPALRLEPKKPDVHP
jgi:hypothetical protein